MKKFRVTPTNWRALLALCAVSAGFSPLLCPTPAHAARRRPMLEIWPGRRVLLVLPLKIGPDWNAGPELAQAIQPLVRPQLQQALTDTDKFSVTLPYRFDPVLRRAVSDKKLSDDVVSALIANPSLETALPVFSSLTFNQTPMVADVQLEELRVGGTAKAPTVQLQVSGKLYEVGGNGPFRNVVVTSRAFGGRTPEARLQAAAADAFREMAMQFIEPPEAFQLPALVAPAPATSAGAATPATGEASGKMLTGEPTADSAMAGSATPKAPAATPNSSAPTGQGGSIIPQLPPAQPPLGVAVPQEPTVAR